MTRDKWTDVDKYVSELLAPEDSALHEALAASRKAGLPSIQVTPAQGKFLQLLAIACGAKRILEIGTLGGYSTIWLARGVPSDGRLITLEFDSKHAETARANIKRAGLDKIVEVRLGKALETLPQIQAEGLGPFDLTFIDADKVSYPEYLDWAIKLSRRGSIIVADNVVRDGKVADASCDDPSVKAVRRYLEMMASDKRISGTVIQTVGSKGYDGFAVGVVG